MENFKTFMEKHGETGVQALLENWERFEEICYVRPISLEQRWMIFIHETSQAMRTAA